MTKKVLITLAKIKVRPKGLHKLNTEYDMLTTNRSLPTYQVGPRNPCNLRLINDLRLRKFTYEKINFFCKTNPIFKKVK